jgi:hypothetical protein
VKVRDQMSQPSCISFSGFDSSDEVRPGFQIFHCGDSSYSA